MFCLRRPFNSFVSFDFVMAQNRLSNVTVEQVKAAMREILQAFEKPENKAKLQEIEQDAGNDLVKLVQVRLPFAAEIQQEVIKSHGFSDDGDQGSLTFTHAIKLFEKDDEEIAEMAADLKTRFIPLLPRPPLFVPRDVT